MAPEPHQPDISLRVKTHSDATWLAWCLCVMLAIFAVMATFITFGVPWLNVIYFGMMACLSYMAGRTAVHCERLPPTHWVHRNGSLAIGVLLGSLALLVLISLMSNAFK